MTRASDLVSEIKGKSIRIRVTERELVVWKRRARAADMSLSQWLRSRANRADLDG